MAFTRAKPAGWSSGQPFTAAQVNQIDINQSRAVDGYAGGTYTPSSPLSLSNVQELGITSGTSVTRREILVASPTVASEWNASTSGYWLTTVNTATSLIIPLRPPDGMELIIVGVAVRGATGHAWPIGSMPTMEFKSITMDGVTTTIGTDADGSSSAVDYEAWHALVLSPVSHTVDIVNNAYFLVVTSESGANALAGFMVGPTSFSGTPASYPMT